MLRHSSLGDLVANTMRLGWVLYLIVVIILLNEASSWRRRRRRRCATNSCTWNWEPCSKTCGGGQQNPVKTANQGECGTCDMPSGPRDCNTQCCARNCTWYSWGNWSSCSRSCGEATQTRTRGQSKESCGGEPCTGIFEETRPCEKLPCCPMNCSWSSWNTWDSCSATCGGGLQMRSRGYSIQASCGGDSCAGSPTESRACNQQCCAVNCSWAPWGIWSSCPVTCGGGTQTRSRGYAVAASCGGSTCPGVSSESRSCNQQCCAIHCSWATWGNWGSCSQICGGGTQSRSRGYAVASSCGGSSCSGSFSESRNCNAQCCPVNCSWASWGNWGACSVTCGGGTQFRNRDRSVSASCGGNTCPGKSTESRTCGSQCCPVDCSWDVWSNWGSCSHTCGGGEQSRNRRYSAVAYCGGTSCSGPTDDSRVCNAKCCPVNCAWTNWYSWSACSLSCGGGVKVRIRGENPVASCNGNPCTGLARESQTCNTNCCPVNCVWEEWSTWSTCTKSCGSGVQKRSRSTLIPSYCGGNKCTGPETEEQLCNAQCCAVDCKWTTWEEWSACTKTCERGSQYRIRSLEVSAFCGGNQCQGTNKDSRVCNDVCCPIHCQWEDWSEWNQCTKSCETGWQSRARSVAKDAVCNGEECKGSKLDNRTCNTQCCPVDCVMSVWSKWSECSQSCGVKGTQERNRVIVKEPECGGRACELQLHDINKCNRICFNSGNISNETCICESGWEGDCCHRDIDECASNSCKENSKCFNSRGSYECICNHGYTMSEGVCLDVDECHEQKHDCHVMAGCVNLDGRYSCHCDPGFSGNGFNCSDVDECITLRYVEGQDDENSDDYGPAPLCHEDAVCTNSYGSYSCQCNPGFIGDGVDCRDVDECQVLKRLRLNSSINPQEANFEEEDSIIPCDVNANCFNILGSYWCKCKPGYTGNGTTCNEIDECDSKPCMYGGTCADRVNGFVCSCPSGLTGERCQIDLDECFQDLKETFSNENEGSGGKQPLCDPEATCSNTFGSYKCTCNIGYTGNGESCHDIDECTQTDERQEYLKSVGESPRYLLRKNSEESVCHKNAVCNNIIGSFFCTCNRGYEGNGLNCTEINECFSDPCSNEATCVDIIDGFSCECSNGYKGTYCDIDIHDCQKEIDDCDATGGKCINTPGSHECVCKDGFSGDGKTCIDINECETQTHNCTEDQNCINTIGGFSCTCLDGYEMKDGVCKDVDECLLGNHNCTEENQRCVNEEGEYRCACREPYIKTNGRCEIEPTPSFTPFPTQNGELENDPHTADSEQEGMTEPLWQPIVLAIVIISGVLLVAFGVIIAKILLRRRGQFTPIQSTTVETYRDDPSEFDEDTEEEEDII